VTWLEGRVHGLLQDCVQHFNASDRVVGFMHLSGLVLQLGLSRIHRWQVLQWLRESSQPSLLPVYWGSSLGLQGTGKHVHGVIILQAVNVLSILA
jgi:hypothetical protein